MDASFLEKKWFVYIGDHHEGPFSVAELKLKVDEGLVNSSSFVWAEGMPDWVGISTLPEFVPLFAPTPVEPVEQTLMQAAPVLLEPEAAAPLTPEVSAPLKPEVVAPLTPQIESPARGVASPQLAVAPVTAPRVTLTANTSGEGTILAIPAPAVPFKAQGASREKRRLFVTLSISVVVVAAFAVLAKEGMLDLSKIPALAGLFSPIQKLDDVDDAEFEELKQAARTKLDEGPRVALARSKSDVMAPRFHIATNLPDGTKIQVRVAGQMETLLSESAVQSEQTIVVANHQGATEPFRNQGKGLPRGSYQVFVFDADTQSPGSAAELLRGTPMSAQLPTDVPKGRRLALVKSYFLGGPKDSTYADRLKELHDRISAGAAAELKDLKQFSATIESQLATAVDQFKLIRAIRNKKQRAQTWMSFDSRWTQMMDQIRAAYPKWDTSAMASGVYYTTLFPLLKEASADVDRVHEKQLEYMKSPIEPAGFDATYEPQVSQAKASLEAIKAKIEQADKQSSGPAGIPSKEGL